MQYLRQCSCKSSWCYFNLMHSTYRRYFKPYQDSVLRKWQCVYSSLYLWDFLYVFMWPCSCIRGILSCNACNYIFSDLPQHHTHTHTHTLDWIQETIIQCRTWQCIIHWEVVWQKWRHHWDSKRQRCEAELEKGAINSILHISVCTFHCLNPSCHITLHSAYTPIQHIRAHLSVCVHVCFVCVCVCVQ